MKKYRVLAWILTAVSFLACVLTAASRIALLQQSQGWFAGLCINLSRFVYSGLLPAVCMVLLGFMLLKKISLGLCCLLTLVNFTICGISTAAGGDLSRLMNVYAWYVNAQGLIMKVCPVWFTAVLVFGAMEKKPVIWLISAAGLLMMIFLQTVVPAAFSGTTASEVLLHLVTGGSLVLIALLGIYDRRSPGRARAKGTAHRSVFRGKAEERILEDQGNLIQNVDTLGGTATDGLNRFV